MWGNMSDDPVVMTLGDERVIGPGPKYPDGMIDRRWMSNFNLGFGLGDVFSLCVDAPIVVWQQGFEPSAPNAADPFSDLVASGIGDLRITPKFVIADIHQGYPVGLSFLAQASVPTGSTRSFIGEGGASAMPLLALEIADGSVHNRDYRVRGALNAGALIKEVDTFRDVQLGPAFVYRAAISAHPAPAVELGGEVAGSVAGSRVAHVPLEILPYLKLFPLKFVTFNMGAGFGVASGLGSPDLRVFAGGTIAPSFDPLSLDRDHDGVPNKFDECINIPEDIDGFEDEDGCPDEDNDRDGLLDATDGCPDDPEDFDDYQDLDGCPDEDNDRDNILDIHDSCPNDPEDYDEFQDLDGCPDPDNDRDTFLDLQDACPNAAETFNGFLDEDGCPDAKPFLDTDGDGIQDDADSCPFDPEDFDNFEDEDGCPDPDNDFDGIFDIMDSCPFDPETMNGYLDEDGCPDDAPARVVIERSRIRIAEKIFFEYNKAVIQPLSYELLQEIAGVIQDHPNVTKIRIEGHTDSDGSESYNQKLSQQRAKAVANFLVEVGVDQRRLESVGYGESEPVDTNKTLEGRAANRRVEFEILERDD
jgi:outer membrane protein OmpA-like peptidoglycan-associated protein